MYEKIFQHFFSMLDMQSNKKVGHMLNKPQQAIYSNSQLKIIKDVIWENQAYKNEHVYGLFKR